MIITILNNTVTDKGKYKELDVAYKDSEGKTQGKKIMSFSQVDTFNTLSKAAAGESYEVKPVKNDKGYWDWTETKKINGSTITPTEKVLSTGNPVRSTYETPEERFQKQIYIVRQSSISNALEFLSKGGVKKFEVSDVLDVATQFEEYVFGKKQVKASTTGGLAEMDDDIPL